MTNWFDAGGFPALRPCAAAGGGTRVSAKRCRRWWWFSALAAAYASAMSLYLRANASLPATTAPPPSSSDPEEPPPPSCLRARVDLVPPHMRGASYLIPPVINLGLPKMGSTSLQNFFSCAGYGSSHWWCRTRIKCAECIQDSVTEGLPPFSKCGGGPVYTQIDGFKRGKPPGELYFPQVELLDKIIAGGYGGNATYLLTFRDMGGWYQSITHWRGGPGIRLPPMRDRMARAGINVTGLSLSNFTNFVCDHVERVRAAVPAGRLVEVDIDDPGTGRMLSEVFDVDEGCWKMTNANPDLRRRDDGGGDRDDATTGTGAGSGSEAGGTDEIGGRSTTPPASPRVEDLFRGTAMIRGKGGTMRKNPTFVPSGGEGRGKALI